MTISLKHLTEEQRIEAKQTAKDNIRASAGQEPQREQFTLPKPKEPKIEGYLKNITNEYPSWFNRTTMTLLIIVFIGLAFPSLVRLILVGKETFQHDINDAFLSWIAGFATFLTAEFMLIVCTIAFRTIAKGWFMRIALLCAMGMALAMALVGNHEVVQPETPFEWLETVVPPLGTLIMGLVLEHIMLHSIEARAKATGRFNMDYEVFGNEHRAIEDIEKQEFALALSDWQQQNYQPEKTDNWKMAYATVLRDSLHSTNSKGRGKQERIEYMESLSGEQWKELVIDEMKRENWMSYEGDSSPANFTQEVTDSPTQQPNL